MSRAITIGSVVILSFVELFFAPLPVTFLFLFLWSQFGSRPDSLLSAFVAGLLFDSVLLRPFGSTSLLFLVLLFVGFLYQRKFHTKNSLFVAMLAFVNLLIVEFTYTGGVNFGLILFYSILTVFLARILFRRKATYEAWNRVS